MKKILVIVVCVLALLIFHAGMTVADEVKAKADAQAGLTTGSINSPIMEFKSDGGKAQPIPVQDINIPSPMHLFVYAEDYRNIMTIFKFVHEHPAPFRWQLERWAKGSSSIVVISTISDCLGRKNKNDQILFTFDADLVRLTLDSAHKVVAEAKHQGSGTGNTTSTKVISIQNLCRLALDAMDRGHNIMEIKAQVIASKVEGDTKGIAIGAGVSNVNSGGTAISFPLVLGWAKGVAGKVGLEGIQAELYYKSVISFKEDGEKTQRYIEEEIWKKKPQPQPKAATPLPTPAPNCEKCEAALKQESEALDEALKELAKEKSKPIMMGPRACPITIHFPRATHFPRVKNTYIPYPEDIKKFAQWAEWIKKNEKELAEIGYIGGRYKITGHCDIYELLGIDLINPALGFWRGRYGLASLIELLGGFDRKKIEVDSGGSDTPWHPEARVNVEADEPLHLLNRHICLVWTPDEGSVHGHAHMHAEVPPAK